MTTCVDVTGVDHDTNITGGAFQPGVKKFKLYLTPLQEERLVAQGHAARFLWNSLHAWWLELPAGPKPSVNEVQTWVKDYRNSLPWLKDALPAQAAIVVGRDYRDAWVRCWQGLAGAPKFKARSRTKLSVDAPQGRDFLPRQVSKRYTLINLPLITRRGEKKVKVRTHEPFPMAERVHGGRLVQEADGWYLAARYDQEAPVLEPAPGDLVGGDRGVYNPLVTSDGAAYQHAAYISEKDQRRQRRAEKAIVRKRKAQQVNEETGEVVSSKRLEAEYDKLRDIAARGARRRKDFNHKVSRLLADGYRVIAFEILDTSAMTKRPVPVEDPQEPGKYLPNGAKRKAGLNRRILGEAWYQLQSFTEYKVKPRGGEVIYVPSAYSSQECHACGFTAAENRKSQALFACQSPSCGWTGHADYNASLVVRQRGLNHRERFRGPEGSTQGIATTDLGHAWVPKSELRVVTPCQQGNLPL